MGWWGAEDRFQRKHLRGRPLSGQASDHIIVATVRDTGDRQSPEEGPGVDTRTAARAPTVDQSAAATWRRLTGQLEHKLIYPARAPSTAYFPPPVNIVVFAWLDHLIMN